MPESPTPRRCTIGPVEIGPGRPLAVIAGPCTLESLDMGLAIGETVRDACAQLGLAYVFKASFDKANRTSVTSPRGPGMDEGLAHLATIRETLGVPVTTDIHDPAQAAPVAAVVDCLQIPAFLCRQSDLLAAAAEAATARQIAVNVKKGQFLSPAEMVGPVRKLSESGCENVLLTERGTFFGYHRLACPCQMVTTRVLRRDALDAAARLGNPDGRPAGPGPAARAGGGRFGGARGLHRVPPGPVQGVVGRGDAAADRGDVGAAADAGGGARRARLMNEKENPPLTRGARGVVR